MMIQRSRFQVSRPSGRSRKARGAGLAVILGMLANASLALPNEREAVDFGDAETFKTAAPAAECRAVCPFPGLSDDAGEPTTQPVLPVVPQTVSLPHERQ